MIQLEHGVFLSHFIFLCWQRTQARILGAFPEEGVAAEAGVAPGVGAPAEAMAWDSGACNTKRLLVVVEVKCPDVKTARRFRDLCPERKSREAPRGMS